MLSEQAIIDQFCRAMREHDIDVSPADIIADGRFHRVHVDGDRNKAKNGWYVLHNDSSPAGMFGCNRRYGNETKFTWKADRSATPLTAEERKAFRQEMNRRRREKDAAERAERARAAERANQIWAASREVTEHPYLTRKGIQSHGLRVGTWEKIDTGTGEIRLVSKSALLIPIRNIKKEIFSLQAIFSSDKNPLSRDKDYLAQGQKRGMFYSIGKPVTVDGKMVIIIVEGYATGASVHEASGHAVIVAFDASNLMEVGKVLRERFPDATLIFAADNDRWTLKPIENPGVTRAREAAEAVGGLVAIPDFEDITGNPTDFNDLHVREGLQAVEACVAAALYPPPDTPDDNDELDDPLWDVDADDDQVVSEKIQSVTSADDHADAAIRAVEKEGGFSVLGYDRESYFVFLHEKKQIMDYGRRDFSASGLIEIADRNFWEHHFAGKNGIDTNAAQNFLIRTAHRRGIYDKNRVRAGGAWFDNGRHVFHHGSHLSVDSIRTDVTKIKSHYVYELTVPLPPPSDTPLSDADGKRILDMAKMFRWSMEGSAALLAGWIFLAPICGALRWRPHIWLTGPAGNGKSTILQKFVYPLLGKNGCKYVQGNSSEAGVRQEIGSKSVPVLLDEAEKNNDREAARVENLLSLIRQSSSESDAMTLKGTVNGDGMSFNVRSMFCLASILAGMDKKADIDRLSVLNLMPSRGAAGSIEHWEKTSNALYELTRDEGMRGRMLRRAINMMPRILENIEVFVRSAAKVFGSQRDGDQYGTLLAGVWCLTSSEPATGEDADKLINQFQWGDQMEQTETDDSQAAMSELMGAIIIEGGLRASVHELISRSLNEEIDGLGLSPAAARSMLRRNGLMVVKDRLLLPNQSRSLRKLLEGTPFAADPKSVFGRVRGATNNDGKRVKFNGIQTRVISLPLSLVGFGGSAITDESELF